jgi:HEAT repeat protein
VALIAAFSLLLAGSAGLLVVLVALVVVRKWQRDHREAHSRRRRDRLAHALASGNPRALRRALGAVKDRASQVDLCVALERADTLPEGLQRAAMRAGVVRRMERQLHSHSAPARGRASLILGYLRLPDGVRRLEQLLDDEDPDVRLATVAGLPRARDPAAVGALVGALSRRRLAPERVIERLGQPWAVGALLDALAALDEAGERRAAPRVGISRALGVAGDRRAEPALINLLDHGAPEERISAARALGELGGPNSRPSLERALADEAWALRAQAAKALGRVGDPRAVPALAVVLDDRAWWVRANAATALRRLGPPGLDALAAALDHPDPFARDRAREALALETLRADAQPTPPSAASAELVTA